MLILGEAYKASFRSSREVLTLPIDRKLHMVYESHTQSSFNTYVKFVDGLLFHRRQEQVRKHISKCF